MTARAAAKSVLPGKTDSKPRARNKGSSATVVSALPRTAFTETIPFLGRAVVLAQLGLTSDAIVLETEPVDGLYSYLTAPCVDQAAIDYIGLDGQVRRGYDAVRLVHIVASHLSALRIVQPMQGPTERELVGRAFEFLVELAVRGLTRGCR